MQMLKSITATMLARDNQLKFQIILHNQLIICQLHCFTTLQYYIIHLHSTGSPPLIVYKPIDVIFIVGKIN